MFGLRRDDLVYRPQVKILPFPLAITCSSRGLVQCFPAATNSLSVSADIWIFPGTPVLSIREAGGWRQRVYGMRNSSNGRCVRVIRALTSIHSITKELEPAAVAPEK